MHLQRPGAALFFVKGTGDGLLIVLEVDEREVGAIARGFVEACTKVIRDLRGKEGLAIGCGIDAGLVTQVFLLGQSDYLGTAVNQAAKLQQQARNEICVSPGLRAALFQGDALGVQIAESAKERGPGLFAIAVD